MVWIIVLFQVSNLDFCILAILNGVVHLQQHLLLLLFREFMCDLHKA